MASKLQTFKDEFNGTALQSAPWFQFTAGGASFTYASSGATVVMPAATDGTTDGDISSNTTYNLVDSYAVLEVLSVAGSTATHTDNELRLKIDGSNYIEWQYEGTGGGVLYANKDVGGVNTHLVTLTYDSVAHRWWRIRELNGKIYWDTSPDGVSWTNQYNEATPITITALTVLIGATCFGVDTNPANFKFRNFNIKPFGTKFNNAGLRPRPFAPGLAR